MYMSVSGVHKHFRILNIQRYINKNMGTDISVADIWQHLELYFNLSAIDDKLDAVDAADAADAADAGDQDAADPDPATLEQQQKRSAFPFLAVSEFSLPLDEFAELLDARRRADAASPIAEAQADPEADADAAGHATPDPSSSTATSLRAARSPSRSQPALPLDASTTSAAATASVDPATPAVPVKRRPGRPRKYPRPEDLATPPPPAVPVTQPLPAAAPASSPVEQSRKSLRFHPAPTPSTPAAKKRRS
eukprot:jgi/Hompol1/4532/HPOL_000945-RA